MFVEELKYAISDAGGQKEDEVTLEFYSSGSCFLVPLTPDRISIRRDTSGNQIVVFDVTDN
jgi:hypothetical protein